MQGATLEIGCGAVGGRVVFGVGDIEGLRRT